MKWPEVADEIWFKADLTPYDHVRRIMPQAAESVVRSKVAQFGFGAEIGISTQKLHARGPMSLRELTSSKFVIYGEGQVRP